MKIDTIKDLEKIVKLCRKAGVDIIKIGDIEIVLDKSFKTSPRRTKAVKQDIQGVPLPGGIDEATQIFSSDIETPDELTEEQLLFGSSDPTVWAEQ